MLNGTEFNFLFFRDHSFAVLDFWVHSMVWKTSQLSFHVVSYCSLGWHGFFAHSIGIVLPVHIFWASINNTTSRIDSAISATFNSSWPLSNETSGSAKMAGRCVFSLWLQRGEFSSFPRKLLSDFGCTVWPNATKPCCLIWSVCGTSISYCCCLTQSNRGPQVLCAMCIVFGESAM